MKKQTIAFLTGGIAAMIITGCHSKKPGSHGVMSAGELMKLKTELAVEFNRLEPQVIRSAEGYLKYPYLIPAGFYKQMWDWDGFFIANHLASAGKPEYLKYWALNLIAGIDSTGFVAGCATTEGPRAVFGKFAMKPFLSQGVYFASVQLNDFSWVEPCYDALMKSLEYRDRTQLDSTYNCYYWENAGQSGADNNPAMNYFEEDTRSYLAPDASTFQLREIIAQALIAGRLGKKEDHRMLTEKAAALEKAINRHLWCEEDQIYYTVDRETGAFYKRVSYSGFIPLMQKLAPGDKGKEMIRRYLINPRHMKANYGYRSLSAQDPDYNNKNIIIPFSNWQGPVWPIANYLYSIGLKNYGFDDELRWLAGALGKLALDDIRSCGSMHENYHADTGAPLAPAAGYVDASGRFVGFVGWNLCIRNILEGVTEDRWMLLELPEAGKHEDGQVLPPASCMTAGYTSCIAKNAGNTDIIPPDSMIGLRNKELSVRQDLARGGAICHISAAGEDVNLVNVSDEGRYIQQSYYAGNSVNRQTKGQSPYWSPWSWNPIQAGDYALNRARILEYKQGGNDTYVKCIPMQWDMAGKPAEAVMEQWLELKGNVIRVRNKLTCHRTDTIYGEGVLSDQEIPAVYLISRLDRLFSYFGNRPFEGDAVQSAQVIHLEDSFWGIYDGVRNPAPSEQWMAFVNSGLRGVGIYSPSATRFLAGMFGKPGGDAHSISTSYIAPVRQEALNKTSVMEYDYYLIVGTLEQIRSAVYQLKKHS